MKKMTFFKETLKNWRTTGAIVRSSQFLCQEMLRPVDFQQATVIIELGAGDGVFTHELLKKMRPDARLLCFEIQPAFCEILREVKDSRFILIEDSAELVEMYMARYELTKADYVISGIPFVSLPDELSYKIVGNCYKILKSGGLYIQFHYTTFVKKMYRNIFGNVDITFVPLNFPPAFVMICEKK
jgi:phospholipid N-methyltransferase